MERLCEKILRISTGEKIQFDQHLLAENLENILLNACRKGSKALVISAGNDGELGASLLYYLMRLKEQKYCGNCEIILDAPGILSEDLIPVLLYPDFPIMDEPVYKDGFRILKKNEREEYFQEYRKQRYKSEENQEVQIIVTVSGNENSSVSHEYLNRWLDHPDTEFAFIGSQNSNPLEKALVENQKLVTIKHHQREVCAKIHHLMENSD